MGSDINASIGTQYSSYTQLSDNEKNDSARKQGEEMNLLGPYRNP